MNNFKPINESGINKMYDVNEQAKELSKTLKKAATEAEKINALVSFFKVDAKTVQLAAAKDLTTLEKELKSAIAKDLKGGFRGGKTGSLGSSAKMAAKQKAINEILSSNKALDESQIISIIERVKSESKLKAINAEAKFLGKEVASTGKEVASTGKAGGKDVSKKFGTKIKELLSNIKIKKMSWKQLLVWGAGLSIGGAALWYLIKQNSDVIPDGMPTTPPNPKDDWGPCLSDLVKANQGKVVTNTSGVTVVLMSPNEKYPKGLTFYPNNRVVNNQTNDKGTWKCVGGQAQTNENMGKTQVNESIGQIVKRVLNEKYLMEQSTAEIDSDVEDMIDYLDAPVYGNDYVNIYNLLKKYSTNGKYNEFAEQYNDAGIQKTTLRSDINSIVTIDAAPTRMKKQILALLDQIEGGKVPVTPAVNTNNPPRKVNIIGEQSDLKIVWDKDAKVGGGGGNTGGGGTTRRTYYDCSGVNIETTPLTYGCKDTKIGEIQGCLGLTVDNKFGPNTRKELKNKGHDITNGITKAIYDKVKANCSQTASTQTYADNSAALTSDYMKRNPIKMDLGPVPQMPTKNTSASGASASEGMTGEDYYTSLLQKGLINPSSFLGRRKVAYNGPVLGQSDIQRLNNFLEGKNYFQTNDEAYKLTDAGEKYVWIQQ
jgi:hypothetical protein